MKKTFVNFVSLAFFGSIIGKGLRYGLSVSIARVLGADSLGIFSFGFVVLQLLSIPAMLGLNQAAQKFVPVFERENTYDKLTGTIIICLIGPVVVGGLISVVVYTQLGVVSRFVAATTAQYLPFFVLAVPLFATFRVAVFVTKGFKTSKYAVLSRDIVQSGAALVLVTVAGIATAAIEQAIVGYLVSIVLGTATAVYFIYRQGGFSTYRPTFPVKEVLVFSLPLILLATCFQLMEWSDVFLLGIFVTNTKLGWYQAAFQTSVLVQITLQATNALFPAVASDLYSDGSLRRLERIFTSVTKWITFTSLAGGLFLIVFASEMLDIFGFSAETASVALIILAVAQIVTAATGPSGYLLMMSGNERIETLNTIGAAILNVVLNVILIRELGIVGAAIATGLSLSLYNLVKIVEIKLLFDILPYTKQYWKGLVAVLASMCVAVPAKLYLVDGPLGMFVVGVASFLIFVLSNWALGIEESDRILLESV